MTDNVKGEPDLVDLYVILLHGEEVYVGYSSDIPQRWIQYKSAYVKNESVIHQEMLTQFMVKHGWYNFSIELVEKDVRKFGVIDKIDEWVEAYRLIGCEMLNKVRTGVSKIKHRENCSRCGLEINARDRARHQRSMKCQLLHRGFGTA